MAAPPVYKIPDAPQKAGGIGGQLAAMLKTHGPAWQKYAPTILKWAQVYKIDPLYVAAVLLTENASANPTARSSAGAVGPAQILDSTINAQTNPNAVWDGPTVLTDAWKQNFNNAIKYVSWRMAGAINARGSLDAAYAGGYNTTAYAGAPPSSLLPKGYTGTTGPGTQPTPAETAGPAVAGTNARKALTTTQWAVMVKGKLKFVATHDQFDPDTGQPVTSAPKGTLTVFGQPLTSSAFLQQYASITDDFVAYTGRRPDYATAAKIIKAGTSQFSLRQNLARDPGFVNSPVWKQNAPGYEAVWHSVYGDKVAPDQAAIRSAVANNVGSSAFQDQLRGRPDYNTSSEYLKSYAANENVYAQIYGRPTQADSTTIDAAVKNGYDANQFASYLRNQPQWKSSAEAQTLYYGLAQNMGLIDGGKQSVLQNG
jgi:transglycosylase-like protein with SLT domain